jgi:hypothetical protein
VLVRTSSLHSAGLFNEKYRFAEDWDMWLRIYQRYQLDYLQETLCSYRIDAAHSITRDNSAKYHHWEQVITDQRDSGVRGIADYYRAMSWYWFNRSYEAQVASDKKRERGYLYRSLLAWPFFFPKRYLALMRTFLDEKYYALYRKLKGAGE